MKPSQELNLLNDSKDRPNTFEEIDAVKVDSIWEPIDCLLHSDGSSSTSGGGSSNATNSSPPCYSKCFQGF
jgi:hypothetical protein